MKYKADGSPRGWHCCLFSWWCIQNYRKYGIPLHFMWWGYTKDSKYRCFKIWGKNIEWDVRSSSNDKKT